MNTKKKTRQKPGPVRRILANLGWLALGGAFLVGAVHSLQTGEVLVSSHGSSYTATRDSNPIQFWGEVVIGLMVGGLVVLAKLHTVFSEAWQLFRGNPPELDEHPVPTPRDLKPLEDLRSFVNQLPSEERTDQEDADKRLVACLRSPDEIPAFDEVIGRRPLWQSWIGSIGSTYRFPAFGPHREVAKLRFGVLRGGSLSIGLNVFKIRNASTFGNAWTLEHDGESCAQGSVKHYGMVDQMRDALSGTNEEFVSRAQEQESIRVGSFGDYISVQADGMYLSLVPSRFGDSNESFCIVANGVLVGSIGWHWSTLRQSHHVSIQCNASVPEHLQLFLIWLRVNPKKQSPVVADLLGGLGKQQPRQQSVDQNTFKCACAHCDGHIEAPAEAADSTVVCPHCHRNTVLRRPNAASPGVLINLLSPREASPVEPVSSEPMTASTAKGWLVTFFFALFLGGLGVDRFYNGRIVLGIGKLLTVGAFGLWSLIDVLLLLFKKYQDAHGNYLMPAKRSHMVTALSIVVVTLLLNVIAVGVVVQRARSQFANEWEQTMNSTPPDFPEEGAPPISDTASTPKPTPDAAAESMPAVLPASDSKPTPEIDKRKAATALEFDGTNDWLELSPIDWQALPAFTVEVWVRDWHGSIMNQGKVGDPENSIWLGLGRVLNTEIPHTSGWESKGRNVQFVLETPPTNRWVHVAMIYDGKNQALYLDGQPKRNVAATRPGPFDMRRALTIGKGGKGDLRSVRVSSTARYRSAFRPDGSWNTDSETLLLLAAESRTGSLLKDLSMHGRDAKIHGATAIQVE